MSNAEEPIIIRRAGFTFKSPTFFFINNYERVPAAKLKDRLVWAQPRGFLTAQLRWYGIPVPENSSRGALQRLLLKAVDSGLVCSPFSLHLISYYLFSYLNTSLPIVYRCSVASMANMVNCVVTVQQSTRVSPTAEMVHATRARRHTRRSAEEKAGTTTATGSGGTGTQHFLLSSACECEFEFKEGRRRGRRSK